ncbi:hypothetical protein ACFYZJ_16790 [Streptomyces sp. NPDC001848]|uniref:hypothetical protein n=1 Tax=Streptomyces sp. NPDC001848 TaxID=3364618 RepID=UPI0036783CD2
MRRRPFRTGTSAPQWLGSLSPAERRVWRAFPHGELVDLGVGDAEADDPANAEQWPTDRSVRGEVIAALLLGACPAAPGAVTAVRITGARITGQLCIDHGEVCSLLQLRGCRFDNPVDLDDASTQSIDLRYSRLTTISALGAQVRGTLDLRDTVITGEDSRALHADGIRIEGSLLANRISANGSFWLINAHVGGQVTFTDAALLNPAPNGVSLNAGGIQVGRSLLGRRLRTLGELRIPGAEIGSSLVLEGAELDGNGRAALYGDSLTVRSESSFRPDVSAGQARPFRSTGSVRLLGAKFIGDLDLGGARLTAAGNRPALHGRGMTVEGSLHLTGGFHTAGEIRLTGARITGHLDIHGMDSPDALLTLYAATATAGVNDSPEAWPARLNLDGFVYGPFSQYSKATERLRLLTRQVRRSDDSQVGGFRAQPYEQLADYYRSLGNDGEARTVLLAKQRAQRQELPWLGRVPAYLLDLLVGYGYRPLRAIGWVLGLLIASSAYFSTVRPERINTEDHSVFNPVLYAADHLVPVIRFGQTDVWQYHGTPAVVTAALTVLGWTLGIAIAAAASRTLTRN